MTSKKMPRLKNHDQLVELLALYIQEQWTNLEEANLEDTKQSMIDFLDYCENLQITGGQNRKAGDCLIDIQRMIERILQVDMRPPANRKGALPEAIGLVKRKNEQLRDHVIFLAYDHARYGTGEASRTHDICDELVSRALEKAKGITLDPDNIHKIYQRMSEIL